MVLLHNNFSEFLTKKSQHYLQYIYHSLEMYILSTEVKRGWPEVFVRDREVTIIYTVNLSCDCQSVNYSYMYLPVAFLLQN